MNEVGITIDGEALLKYLYLILGQKKNVNLFIIIIKIDYYLREQRLFSFYRLTRSVLCGCSLYIQTE